MFELELAVRLIQSLSDWILEVRLNKAMSSGDAEEEAETEDRSTEDRQDEIQQEGPHVRVESICFYASS